MFLIKRKKAATLINRMPTVRGKFEEDVPISQDTFFKTGGNAELVFSPADVDDLSIFLAGKPDDVPVTILGMGANVLIRDGGIRGVVVRLGDAFSAISVEDDEITCGCAATTKALSNKAVENSITRFEFLSGIPGTVGGAIRMNAGAFNYDISKILKTVKGIDQYGKEHWLEAEDLQFSYRAANIPIGWIFTKAIFKGEKVEKDIIEAKIEDMKSKRKSSQPWGERSAGSTFKNPPGLKAWELIEKAGCRGMVYGGAKVSEQHCNFIINAENATANDIEQLGEKVRKAVLLNSGIQLEWEIQRMGLPA